MLYFFRSHYLSGQTIRSYLLLCICVHLCSFIYERIQKHGDGSTVVTRAQLGGGEVCDPNHKKLGQWLQQIGDELDANVELQGYTFCVSVPSN